jgi:hypothetical protein
VRNDHFGSPVRRLAMIFLWGAVASAARADGISSDYTLTDLGSSTFSLITQNGTTIPIVPLSTVATVRTEARS